jgi:hypothetical protein
MFSSNKKTTRFPDGSCAADCKFLVFELFRSRAMSAMSRDHGDSLLLAITAMSSGLRPPDTLLPQGVKG